MALNAEATATEQMKISLLICMNYELTLKEKNKRGQTVITLKLSFHKVSK